MKRSSAWAIIAVVSILALGGTAVTGAVAWQQYRDREGSASRARTSGSDAWATGSRIVFRHTAAGDGYGHVASVPVDDPGGERAITDTVCDRVDATTTAFSCLRTVRSIVPSFVATVYSNDQSPVAQWPLSGIPSRTRFSPDGSRVATTAFVTGHSYATVGFSTQTQIHTLTGESLGDLEEWMLLIDGRPSAPVDRNYWGVTFVDDDTFFATVGLATTDTTYLVAGDLRTQTFTALAENVECPSLSPDSTRIAMKRVTAGVGPGVHWTPAIYDVATGEVRLLPESRSIDDQIEWLDDDTVLYGVPRADAPGDTDVWAVPADGRAAPRIFLEHAWSPSLVREK